MSSKTKGAPTKIKISTKTKAAIAIVLDESGSMATCKDGVISGVNEYLNTLEKLHPGTKVYFTRFSGGGYKEVIKQDTFKTVKDVPRLTSETYLPSGWTPLFDAVGKTLTEMGQLKDHKVFFVIVTDGEENRSTEFNKANISTLIKEKEGLKKNAWQFMYIGSGTDAWKGGQAIGMSRAGDTLTIKNSTNTNYCNAFRSVAVSGMSNVLADAGMDTLTLAGGAGVSITTDNGSGSTVDISTSGLTAREDGSLVVEDELTVD